MNEKFNLFNLFTVTTQQDAGDWRFVFFDIPTLKDVVSGKATQTDSDKKCVNYLASLLGVEGNVFALLWDPVYGRSGGYSGGYRGLYQTTDNAGNVIINRNSESHEVGAAAHFYDSLSASKQTFILAPKGSVTDGKISYFDEHFDPLNPKSDIINHIGAIFFSQLGNQKNVVLQIQHTADVGARSQIDQTTGRLIIGETGGVGSNSEGKDVQVHMELFSVGTNAKLKDTYLHHLPKQSDRRKNWISWYTLCPKN